MLFILSICYGYILIQQGKCTCTVFSQSLDEWQIAKIQTTLTSSGIFLKDLKSTENVTARYTTILEYVIVGLMINNHAVFIFHVDVENLQVFNALILL
jgi:hypothetical protein